MKGTSPSQAIQATVSQNRHHGVQPGSTRTHPIHLAAGRGKKMAIITAGIDLAKNIFAVHGIHAAGKPELVCSSVGRAKRLD